MPVGLLAPWAQVDYIDVPGRTLINVPGISTPVEFGERRRLPACWPAHSHLGQAKPPAWAGSEGCCFSNGYLNPQRPFFAPPMPPYPPPPNPPPQAC